MITTGLIARRDRCVLLQLVRIIALECKYADDKSAYISNLWVTRANAFSQNQNLCDGVPGINCINMQPNVILQLVFLVTAPKKAAVS